MRAEDERPALTAREREILRLTADGRSAPQIAEQLYLSPTTVRTHLQHLYEKLGVSDRAAAVAEAMRQRLLE
jgi:two-component system, NarL family, nitrate/nitrite response regulator NarL